ncbi:sperm microtubule associated protein 2 isoform X2 [Pyxicephalus adspersus]|uniref:sperm microtubule associated protein 2 isoform X2 n=1 Tax=Pyxicephalus adspersus TaxID=30357 RepID=UPI003B5C0CE2
MCAAQVSASLESRLDNLARPKVNFLKYKDRASPIWPVSSRALQAVPSLRVEKLAEPKSVSQHWMEDRSVYTTVTEGAKIASASARIIELARPKNCANNEIPNTPKSYLNEDEDKESLRSNKSVTASARTEALAAPKTEHPQYQHDLPVLRNVPAAALHIQASDRVCQLAKPKIRKHIFEGYDPYRISPAAKNAEASPRITELCTPPARRQRHKKI